MYDFHVHDCNQEQNSSPCFSSIVRQHKWPSLSREIIEIQNFCYHGNVTLHFSSLLVYSFGVCLWLQQAGFQMMARNKIIRSHPSRRAYNVFFTWLILGYSKKTLQELGKKDFELSNIFVDHALHVAWIQFSTQIKQLCNWYSRLSNETDVHTRKKTSFTVWWEKTR